jgi:hypothetical protein
MYSKIWGMKLFRVSQDAEQLWLPSLAGAGPQPISAMIANLGHWESQLLLFLSLSNNLKNDIVCVLQEV